MDLVALRTDDERRDLGFVCVFLVAIGVCDSAMSIVRLRDA